MATIQATAPLAVGMKAWDYGTRVPYATLELNKVNCVLRYLPTSWGIFGPVYTWKSLTPTEIAELQRRNIGVVALWEAGGTDPLQGEPKGLQHGQMALRTARFLGFPAGLPVIAAVDYDVISTNINASAAYMKGFHQGLGGVYATGVYGDTDIIKRCAAENTSSIFHMAGALAWSNRKVIDLVHLLQSISGSTPNWDNNYVLRSGIDMWLPHSVPDIPPDIPPQPPTPVMEDLDAMIKSPALAYDTSDPRNPDGPLVVGQGPPIGSRTINIAPGKTRAMIVVTPVPVSGKGHLRISGDGVEPDFSTAQWEAGHPPQPLSLLVDLNPAGAIDVWAEGVAGASCGLIVARTHVNG